MEIGLHGSKALTGVPQRIHKSSGALEGRLRKPTTGRFIDLTASCFTSSDQSIEVETLPILWISLIDPSKLERPALDATLLVLLVKTAFKVD